MAFSTTFLTFIIIVLLYDEACGPHTACPPSLPTNARRALPAGGHTAGRAGRAAGEAWGQERPSCWPSGRADVGVTLLQEQNQILHQPVLPAVRHSHDIERLKGRERRLDPGAGGPCPRLIVSPGCQGLGTPQVHSGRGAGVLQARRQGPGCLEGKPANRGTQGCSPATLQGCRCAGCVSMREFKKSECNGQVFRLRVKCQAPTPEQKVSRLHAASSPRLRAR